MKTRTIQSDPLADFSLDDLEKAIKGENHKGNARSSAISAEEKFGYTIKQNYGLLSSGNQAPMFALIDWRGALRYDLRRWQDNGIPGKGITFTKDELLTLREALGKFDFGVEHSKVLRKYKAGNNTASVYCKIATLSTAQVKGIIWNKEVCLMNWGYGMKVDFRKWTADYQQCGKGICLSFDETKRLQMLIETVL